MRLVLERGFPHPLIEAAMNPDLYPQEVVIEGVCGLEWRRSLAVIFESRQAYHQTKSQSRCWQSWESMVLVAPVHLDGNGCPMVLYGDKAYCGFRLTAD